MQMNVKVWLGLTFKLLMTLELMLKIHVKLWSMKMKIHLFSPKLELLVWSKSEMQRCWWKWSHFMPTTLGNLLSCSQGKIVIDCKWIYKRMNRSTDTCEKIFKFMLVAKVFTQCKGVDCNEVFAPIAKYNTSTMFVNLYDLLCNQMDVVTSSFDGLLNQLIFMWQSQGFFMKGKIGIVCRLLKLLYGWKKISKDWNIRINDCMHP